MEGNFWFCFAVSDYKMSYLYFITFGYVVSLISPSLRRDEALPLRAWWWLDTLWLRYWSWQLNKWIVLGTNKSLCACPTRPVRAQQPPPFLGDNYKMAGIAPCLSCESSVFFSQCLNSFLTFPFFLEYISKLRFHLLDFFRVFRDW